MLLRKFDFEIKHRPDIKMGHTDALSRAPSNESKDTVAKLIDCRLEIFVTMSEKEQVIAMRLSDTSLKIIMGTICREKTERSAVEHELNKNYSHKKEILYKEVKIKGEKKKL